MNVNEIKEDLIFKNIMIKNGLDEPSQDLSDKIMTQINLHPLKISNLYEPIISRKIFGYLFACIVVIFVPLIVYLSALTAADKYNLKNTTFFDNLFSYISKFISHITWTIPAPLPITVLVIFILVLLDFKFKKWLNINRH